MCVFSEKHLSLRLEYEHYGSVITSDRLILVTATAIDKEDYYEAKKTIVLDEPDIEIKVWMMDFFGDCIALLRTHTVTQRNL